MLIDLDAGGNYVHVMNKMMIEIYRLIALDLFTVAAQNARGIVLEIPVLMRAVSGFPCAFIYLFQHFARQNLRAAAHGTDSPPR